MVKECGVLHGRGPNLQDILPDDLEGADGIIVNKLHNKWVCMNQPPPCHGLWKQFSTKSVLCAKKCWRLQLHDIPAMNLFIYKYRE